MERPSRNFSSDILSKKRVEKAFWPVMAVSRIARPCPLADGSWQAEKMNKKSTEIKKMQVQPMLVRYLWRRFIKGKSQWFEVKVGILQIPFGNDGF
jgi:hypothetical protein